MLIKNILIQLFSLITNINFYLISILVLNSYLLLFTSLRKKFPYFILTTIVISLLGFLINLDGMMLIFLITEFTVMLLFFMTYVQLYSNFTFFFKSIKHWWLLLLTLLAFVLVSKVNLTLYFLSYYKFQFHYVSSDFFILYFILFLKLSPVVVFITLILTFFSLFFILLYFNLKLVKNNQTIKNKTNYFLRKQHLTKQNTFTNELKSFQN